MLHTQNFLLRLESKFAKTSTILLILMFAQGCKKKGEIDPVHTRIMEKRPFIGEYKTIDPKTKFMPIYNQKYIEVAKKNISKELKSSNENADESVDDSLELQEYSPEQVNKRMYRRQIILQESSGSQMQEKKLINEAITERNEDFSVKKIMNDKQRYYSHINEAQPQNDELSQKDSDQKSEQNESQSYSDIRRKRLNENYADLGNREADRENYLEKDLATTKDQKIQALENKISELENEPKQQFQDHKDVNQIALTDNVAEKILEQNINEINKIKTDSSIYVVNRTEEPYLHAPEFQKIDQFPEQISKQKDSIKKSKDKSYNKEDVSKEKTRNIFLKQLANQ